MINNIIVNDFSLVGPIKSRHKLMSVKLLHLIFPSTFSSIWIILKIKNTFIHIFPMIEILFLSHSAKLGDNFPYLSNLQNVYFVLFINQF